MLEDNTLQQGYDTKGHIPANENFFYRLATAWGEITKDMLGTREGEALAIANRKIWNRWWYGRLHHKFLYITQEMLDDYTERLSELFHHIEISGLDSEEEQALRRRMGSHPKAELLNFTNARNTKNMVSNITMNGIRFDNPLVLDGYIFLTSFLSKDSIFSGGVWGVNSKFCSGVDFSNSDFYKDAVFKGCDFSKKLYLQTQILNQ